MAVAEELRRMRKASGLTQAQLAKLAGTSQPRLASYESGAAQPSPAMVARIAAVAKPLPRFALYQHRDEVKRLAERFGLKNVRVFGSVARNTDTRQSDIDLVVTRQDGVSVFKIAAFAALVEDVVGYPVDVVSDYERDEDDRVLIEALAL
ncbi:MAG: helix-turn-helix domain-containing protein [Acidimicrobiales bacterium]